MLQIRVGRPAKSDCEYVFDYRLNRTGADRGEQQLREEYRRYGFEDLRQGESRRFGFRALNFEIRHSELWDSFYPLCYLTRQGGPMYNTPYRKAHIVFDYPVLDPVARFFTARAADLGLDVVIDGERFEQRFDLPTSGWSLSMGGGKDSRMLLGVLREIGVKPLVCASGPENAAGIADARLSAAVSGSLIDRIMPTLMSLPQTLVHGSGLGGTATERPWHRYYDWAAPLALAQTADLLCSIGIEMHIVAPAASLPYNLIQKILHDRYPQLYRDQRSVRPDQESTKNLQIALLKIYSGLEIDAHCSHELFSRLLRSFVREQLQHPNDFGMRRHRKLAHLEMRALVYELQWHPLLSGLQQLPAAWDGPWIHYVHAYRDPDLSQSIRDIYARYAEVLDAPRDGCQLPA